MKFTIRGYDLKMIDGVTGNWNDLGKLLLEIHREDDGELWLAESVENQMENTSNDDDVEMSTLDWKDYVENVSDMVLNCNSPFVFKNNATTNVITYPLELYTQIDVEAKRQCEIYFSDKEFEEKVGIVKLLNNQVNDLQRQLDEIHDEKLKLDEKVLLIEASMVRIDEATATINLYIN